MKELIYKPVGKDNIISCVMCPSIALYFCPDNGEPLCEPCCRRNEEARSKK